MNGVEKSNSVLAGMKMLTNSQWCHVARRFDGTLDSVQLQTPAEWQMSGNKIKIRQPHQSKTTGALYLGLTTLFP